MNSWIEQFISSWGYIGVACLIALENIFPPIPSELILTFSGFMTTRSTMTIVGVIIASTIGSLVGALCLYSIGYFVGEKRLEALVRGNVGRWLRVKPAHIAKATQWFQRHGIMTVFFCRFIPVVRSLISIPAGVAGVPLLFFIVYTTLGSVIWNTVLIVLGAWAGDHWDTLFQFIDRWKYVLLIPVAIVLMYYMLRAAKRR